MQFLIFASTINSKLRNYYFTWYYSATKRCAYNIHV